MTATTPTHDAPTAGHKRYATETGYGHGYTHAAFTDGCGGDPYAEPEVPDRFADIPTHYTAAYADGVNAYLDEHAEP